ncbi:MAG: fumarylacetoacetate hydrolase family protein [Verrucomicrobia bacterium]|nr:fumarylacetoacetate hydrolase family protein [Verrucomicrobiota bacterium]
MRLCRFAQGTEARPAFYFDKLIVPLEAAKRIYRERTHKELSLPVTDDLLAYLPPDGKSFAATRELAAWLETNPGVADGAALDHSKAQILTPLPRPPKLLLLAGNYAAHIEEGGRNAVARQKTFPYVFMKPPSTTLNHPGASIPIPKVSPSFIDWEVELGVILGRRAKAVREEEALQYVAAYTVVNDISDRKFRPNPGRENRQQDQFFDWLHGKWHDGFCPAGPCVRSADSLPDPQKLRLTLKVNGETKQNASTTQQIFPVAAVIAFISSFVTLEPGDIISTGTPSGVGNATGTYLKPGDRMEAEIEGIGVLKNQMIADR